MYRVHKVSYQEQIEELSSGTVCPTNPTKKVSSMVACSRLFKMIEKETVCLSKKHKGSNNIFKNDGFNKLYACSVEQRTLNCIAKSYFMITKHCHFSKKTTVEGKNGHGFYGESSVAGTITTGVP